MNGREALHVPRRAAEALPRPITETGEAERVMPVPAKERLGERPEDEPAAALLRGEAAKIAVEQERGLVRIEPAPARDRWLQCLRGNAHLFGEI